MARLRSALILASLLLLTGCGSSSTPTSTSNPTTPVNSPSPTGLPSGAVVVTGPIVNCVMVPHDEEISIDFENVDQAGCNKYAQELSADGQFWQIGVYLTDPGIMPACEMSTGSVKAAVFYDPAYTSAQDDAANLCARFQQNGWTQTPIGN